MMSSPVLFGILLVAAGLFAGCKSDRPVTDAAAAPAAAPTATPASASTSSSASIRVTATDFKFDLPAQIPAGAVTMHLMNHGQELHHAQVVRLEDGKTVELLP